MRSVNVLSIIAVVFSLPTQSIEACYCSLLEVPKTVARAKAGGVTDATNPRTSHASSAPSISAFSYCSIPDFEKALDRANAVFVGEVVEIIEPLTMDESAPLPGHFFTIRFKVERSWKG